MAPVVMTERCSARTLCHSFPGLLRFNDLSHINADLRKFIGSGRGRSAATAWLWPQRGRAAHPARIGAAFPSLENFSSFRTFIKTFRFSDVFECFRSFWDVVK